MQKVELGEGEKVESSKSRKMCLGRAPEAVSVSAVGQVHPLSVLHLFTRESHPTFYSGCMSGAIAGATLLEGQIYLGNFPSDTRFERCEDLRLVRVGANQRLLIRASAHMKIGDFRDD
jgi:hypothetical protein